MSKKTKVSVVIPVFNEEKNIRPLYLQLKSVLTTAKNPYEIIFVDDGSTDETLKRLLEVKAKGKNVKIIQMQGNFGKASALQAGFDQSRGEYLITLDGDLQDDPREIPNFIKKLAEGNDLVCGWKYRRKDPFEKIFFSKIANFVTNKFTGVNVHDMNCGFKAYRRKVLDNLVLYGGLHRYVPVIVAKRGFQVTELKVNHHPRIYGKSKFGKSRLLRGFFDFITVFFITSFMARPLHLFGLFGLLTSFVGFIMGFYLTLLRLQGQSIGNRPMLLLSGLLIVWGLQFFSLGLIGEMLINRNSDKRYIIKQIYR